MLNKETQDQIAKILLLRGTPQQKLEALVYCSNGVNPPEEILERLIKEDELNSTITGNS